MARSFPLSGCSKCTLSNPVLFLYMLLNSSTRCDVWERDRKVVYLEWGRYRVSPARASIQKSGTFHPWTASPSSGDEFFSRPPNLTALPSFGTLYTVGGLPRYALLCMTLIKYANTNVQQLWTCPGIPTAWILTFLFPRFSLAAMCDGKDNKKPLCLRSLGFHSEIGGKHSSAGVSMWE